MGLLSKSSGKENEESKDKSVFYAQQDELMRQATITAQKNFKYFWREVYWEYRRIIPGHDFAMIKIPFSQDVGWQSEPIVEHMWINNISFDGETITGELVNEPNQLTNVTKGAIVRKKVSEISDWMISIQGKVYGGFTIQAMRSGMNNEQRQHHDQAWGLDFGDPDDILLVYEQKEHPEHLVEHPMGIAMSEKLHEFLTANSAELIDKDQNGLTFLHREAIAGNKSNIEILLALGVDTSIKSSSGKTALDYTKLMNWEHLIEILN